MAIKIEIDDLSRTEIHALLNEHLESMYELSPPESVHALNLDQLRKPEITLWTAWEGTHYLAVAPSKNSTASMARSSPCVRPRHCAAEVPDGPSLYISSKLPEPEVEP
jgi:hypothetical protein